MQRNNLRIDLAMDGNVGADDFGEIALGSVGSGDETAVLDNATECPSPAIVMDLACGIVDLKSSEAVEAAQRVVSAGNFTSSDADGAVEKPRKTWELDDSLEQVTNGSKDDLPLASAGEISCRDESAGCRARGIVELS